MQRRGIGRYEPTIAGGERVRAFVPAPLPPVPALDPDGALHQALESAVLALGRLDGISPLLPDQAALFLYAYVRKEAVLSSQIEGTQSSLSDLLLFESEETPGVPLDDVVEVSNFLDGNGRVGRLLITLLLCHAGVLREPLLYLSLHFKQHRTAYYDLLNDVRRTGDWESWLAFFIDGVRATADGAVSTSRRLAALFTADRTALEQRYGRRAGSALRVYGALTEQPMLSLPAASAQTGLAFRTAASAMELLVQQGIAREITGKRRGRLFVHDRYLAILNEGTEAPG